MTRTRHMFYLFNLGFVIYASDLMDIIMVKRETIHTLILLHADFVNLADQYNIFFR